MQAAASIDDAAVTDVGNAVIEAAAAVIGFAVTDTDNAMVEAVASVNDVTVTDAGNAAIEAAAFITVVADASNAAPPSPATTRPSAWRRRFVLAPSAEHAARPDYASLAGKRRAPKK